MEQSYYSVYMYDTLYAEKCSLETAMVLVASFQEFYADPKFSIRIERMEFEE